MSPSYVGFATSNSVRHELLLLQCPLAQRRRIGVLALSTTERRPGQLYSNAGTEDRREKEGETNVDVCHLAMRGVDGKDRVAQPFLALRTSGRSATKRKDARQRKRERGGERERRGLTASYPESSPAALATSSTSTPTLPTCFFPHSQPSCPDSDPK